MALDLDKVKAWVANALGVSRFDWKKREQAIAHIEALSAEVARLRTDKAELQKKLNEYVGRALDNDLLGRGARD